MKNLEKFLELITAAIAIADKYVAAESTPSWLKKDCQLFIQNMTHLSFDTQRAECIESKGAGLGITKFLSEIGAPHDLYVAGRAVEIFFREHLK